MIAKIKEWAKLGILNRPLTPQILPVQILRIGNWLWLALPGEFTTTSGKRLKQSVLANVTSKTGITDALLIGYSNGYAGYVTTPEEYDVQAYEGASTHFGRWTQPAYQSIFRRLLKRMINPEAGAEAQPNQAPLPPSPRDLELSQAPQLVARS
jgi:neutral ceramidase